MPLAKKGIGTTASIPKTPKPGGSALRDILSDAANKQQRLDALDTQGVEMTRRLESVMRSHVSVRLSTTLSESDDGQWLEQLTYGKHENRWQLLIETGIIGEPDSWNTTPLVSSPRETRMNMFTDGHIERLLRDMVEQLDGQIRLREQMLAAGNGLIEELTDLETPLDAEKRLKREAKERDAAAKKEVQ